jgi:7-carboxy-7-deazaguanine synthase
MKINEIFYSIQGEGAWSGIPNIFIRTTGCNLRCSYCDTKYAYYEGEEIKIDDIIEKIKKYRCKHICITGGEPLLQENIYDLINRLIKKNYYICIETNGSIDINRLSKIRNLLISLDIKCPSSKMKEKNILNNINYLKKTDQLKFIIKDEKDYLYAKKIIEEKKPMCNIYFQPMWKSDPKQLANWIVSDNLNVRLGLQLHKIVWGDKRRK